MGQHTKLLWGEVPSQKDPRAAVGRASDDKPRSQSKPPKTDERIAGRFKKRGSRPKKADAKANQRPVTPVDSLPGAGRLCKRSRFRWKTR